MTDHKQSLTVSSQGGSLNLEAEYNSSLPHPSIIRGYEEVLPGSARELLDMAKAQQAHRHKMEANEQSLVQRASRREMLMQVVGQINATAIILGVIGTCLYLIISGRSVEGILGLIVPLTGMAALFLYKKK